MNYKQQREEHMNQRLIETSTGVLMSPAGANWNPLDSDSDALRLAIDGCFTIELEDDGVFVSNHLYKHNLLYEQFAGDRRKTIRTAITALASKYLLFIEKTNNS
jgi:hypothetical protein